MLIIFRGGDGAALAEVSRDLLVPALDERAEELVRRAEHFEREWVRLNDMIDSASVAPVPPSPRPPAANSSAHCARTRIRGSD